MKAPNQTLWPLRPSLTALALDGLARTLDEIACNYEPEREAALQGVAAATQVFAAELTRFFMGQEPEDGRRLDAIENRWMKQVS